MNTILVLCFVVSAVLANSVQEKWNRVHQQCQGVSEYHVDDNIFDQLKRGERPTLPPNFGLHAYCMLTKLNLQDTEGRVLQDGVRQAVQKHVADSSKLNHIVNECSANQENKEKTALALFKCLGKHHINIGQL